MTKELSSNPVDVIPRVFDEAQRSVAVHKRNVGLLVECRRRNRKNFFKLFKLHFLPVFSVEKRNKPVQKFIQFVVSFATWYSEEDEETVKDFLEDFLRFLIDCATAPGKWTRIYATIILAEVK